MKYSICTYANSRYHRDDRTVWFEDSDEADQAFREKIQQAYRQDEQHRPKCIMFFGTSGKLLAKWTKEMPESVNWFIQARGA